jgi:hypothetical protein
MDKGEDASQYLAFMRFQDLVNLLLRAGYGDIQTDSDKLEPERCTMWIVEVKGMCHVALARYLMPIYEFECNSETCEANARYDKELTISEPHDLDCPFCGETMRKVYSTDK